MTFNHKSNVLALLVAVCTCTWSSSAAFADFTCGNVQALLCDGTCPSDHTLTPVQDAGAGGTCSCGPLGSCVGPVGGACALAISLSSVPQTPLWPELDDRLQRVARLSQFHLGLPAWL